MEVDFGGGYGEVQEDVTRRGYHSTRIPAGISGSRFPSPSKHQGPRCQAASPETSTAAATMSRSTDPGHFFQTDAAESTRARRAAKSGNKNGDPIVLSSKILNATADPFSSTSIYIAESVGCVRKVNVEVGMDDILHMHRRRLTMLQTKDTKAIYTGPNAPLTSVAIGGQGGAVVFAGCWDKEIWSWERESRRPSRRYKGHSDFVKAVICAKIGGKDVSCCISEH